MTTLLTDKNIDAVLMLHWGWTDLLQHVGMVRYYKTLYKSVSLICLPHQREFLEALYPDFELIFVPCPDRGEIDLVTRRLFDEDYLFLVDGHQCSDGFIRSCFRQNLVPRTEIQKLNCEALKKSAWNNISTIKDRDANHPTFDERVGFYTLSGLDHSIAFKYFDIIRDPESEEIKYNQLVSEKEYSLVHYVDGMDLSHANYPIIQINDRSTKIVDMIKVMENAKEIHIYDSLYGVLSYFLYFSGNLKGPKLYLHKYARMKIPKFFDYARMEESGDWTLLE